MAIDITTEQVLTLRDAAKLLPRRRRGRKPHFSTLWRWATRGLRGVRLETIRIGNCLCTSHEALQRFFDLLSAEDGSSATRVRRAPARRRHAQEWAERELDKAGI